MITDADVKTLNDEADPFESAFAAFTRPAEKDAQTLPTTEKAAAGTEKDVQTLTDAEKPTPSAVTGAQTAQEMEAELAAEDVAKAAIPQKPVDSAAQTEETLRRFAEVMEKAVKPAPPAAPVRAAPVEPTIYTPEEKAFMEVYDKDWSTVATGEALKRRAEYRQVVQYVFDQIGAQIKPMMDTLRTLSERTHLGDLEEIAEDYDDIRDKVVDWAANQPTYLKVAYQHVIQNGSAEEVHDLIGRWRVETGTSAAPIGAATASSVTKPAVELTAGAKKAAARLAPVIGKRTGVQTGLDPNDFDAAFDTFAKRLGA